MSWWKRKPPPPTPPPPIEFVDTFSTGVLNSNWIVSTWGAPQGGQFSAANIDLSQGMLRLKLQQSIVNNVVTSVGGEIQLNKLFGYGTYEWSARMGSTAITPTVNGNAVSGGVSGLFNYVNSSATEIDFEAQGQFPNQIDLTNWHTTNAQQFSPIVMATPAAGFHRYKYIWSAGKIEFYIDDVLVKTHLQNIPTSPAYPLINHWGTNSPNFGGVATPGVNRYLYVNKFSYKV